jgi:glycosyltransferase involved in cell wall biosynthesis
MNILILVSSLNFGGAEKQAVLDANMLASSAKVYLGMFEGGDLQKLLNEGVETVQFKKQGYLSTAARLAEYIKEKNITVVHNHLYAPMIISAMASLKVKVPVIWHFHGHHFEVRRFPLNVLSKLPSVKHTVFVCAALARYFEKEYWFPPKKVTVLYNSSQIRKMPELKPKDKVLRIGFIGRVVKLKRIQYLIALASHLKNQGIENFEILIVGDGPERESLEALVKGAQLTDQVKFLGFRTDIENLYNQFDLFVLPSEEEALSLALIDAGMCGLPAVAFDVGGNNEIIRHEETGYIVHSVDELKEKVELLCRDEELRQNMGAKAEEHTRIFSEENHRQSLLNMYEKYA